MHATIFGHLFRILSLWAVCWLPAASAVPQADAAQSSFATAASAWTLTEQYQFAKAQQAFAHELSLHPDSENRITRLGAALAMLNHPALKAKDRDASLAELQLLWDSRGATPDHVGLWAGYNLGRWHQNYVSPPDFNQAKCWFERTATAGKNHYIAQLARLKLAGVWLYAPLPSNPNHSTRVSKALAEDSGITDRGLRISYLIILIDGMLLHQAEPRDVLARMKEVWALNIPPSDTRAKTLCQLGTLSAMEGLQRQAIEYYQQFLEEYPADLRTQLVRDRLAELTAQMEGPRP